jgi:hypothetical protein
MKILKFIKKGLGIVRNIILAPIFVISLIFMTIGMFGVTVCEKYIR